MKNRNLKLTCILIVTVAGVVAWSPPTGEDVTVTNSKILVTGGTIQTRVSGSPANTTGVAPAFIAGSTNNIVRGGTENEKGKGLIVGVGNTASSPTGYLGIIGDTNDVSGRSVLVVGLENSMTPTAVTWDAATKYTAIIGRANVVTGGRESSLIAGISNSVNATSSLISGNANTVEGGTVGAPAWHSAAIGQLNHVMATSGWTMGYSNEVTGYRAIALGSGVKAGAVNSVALGRYNAPMGADDVVALGTGTDENTRNTALRVTADGGVILGRAQGDISMGDFQ